MRSLSTLRRVLLLTTGLILFGSGCMTAGKDFVRPDSRAVTIDRSTRAEILQRYGEPYSTGEITKHNYLLTTLHYYYAEARYGGVVYKKHCWFYFVGETLIGYSFVTGLPDQQISLDSSKVPFVVKGKTTKRDVLAIFGEPTGRFTYPAIRDEGTVAGDSMVVYEVHRWSSAKSYEHKVLEVVFDVRGVVKDLFFDAAMKGTPTGEAPQDEADVVERICSQCSDRGELASIG